MRMIGASQNELELLLAKRYLLAFDSGVVVIKHWKIHNYIQKDRFKGTLYKEELEQLETKDNRSYTESVSILDTNCVQDGYAGKVRLELDKVSIEGEEDKIQFFDYVFLTKTEYNKLVDEYKESNVKEHIEKVDTYLTQNPKKQLGQKDGYKDLYKTLRSWMNKDRIEHKSKYASRVPVKTDLDKEIASMVAKQNEGI